jgi:hypothetical protein
MAYPIRESSQWVTEQTPSVTRPVWTNGDLRAVSVGDAARRARESDRHVWAIDANGAVSRWVPRGIHEDIGIGMFGTESAQPEDRHRFGAAAARRHNLRKESPRGSRHPSRTTSVSTDQHVTADQGQTADMSWLPLWWRRGWHWPTATPPTVPPATPPDFHCPNGQAQVPSDETHTGSDD